MKIKEIFSKLFTRKKSYTSKEYVNPVINEDDIPRMIIGIDGEEPLISLYEDADNHNPKVVVNKDYMTDDECEECSSNELSGMGTITEYMSNCCGSSVGEECNGIAMCLECKEWAEVIRVETDKDGNCRYFNIETGEEVEL